MYKRLLLILMLISSLVMAEELPKEIAESFPDNIKAINFLLENHDLSMSGSTAFWEGRGGFPKELDELEEIGLIYILKYRFGKDGLGFKIYPTEKAITLFELTKLKGEYRYSDIKRNIESAKRNDRYFYITEGK